MSQYRVLLCTDMDRTVIPNGAQIESEQARARFSLLCQRPEVCLVYVTGRHKQLVQEAINQHALPLPSYAITDVGTKIYQINDGQWQTLDSWDDEMKKGWSGRGHAHIKYLLDDVAQLSLQEEGKQSTYKLSYYLPLHADVKTLLPEMQAFLKKQAIDASLVWSIDEEKAVGLLDVLPRNASKLHAIEFLQAHLKYQRDEVIFAGDSGNDLEVLASDIAAILVANASQEIKYEAECLALQSGHESTLYTAKGGRLNMNGNYSAGVLEGVWHYSPALRGVIESSEN